MPETRSAAPSRLPAVLSYGGSPIHDNGELLSLTDMWRASGKDPAQQPAKWRELPSTRAFVAHIANVVLRQPEDGLFVVRRGTGAGTWAHWHMALAYAMYLSPEFHAWANVAIREKMEQAPPPPPQLPNPADPATVLQVIQALQSQIVAQGGRLEALDRLESAEGSKCITDTAKMLKMSRDALARWMVANRWIYRRPGAETWVAYRDKEQALLLEHVPFNYTGRDGTPRVRMQVLVTPKGLTKLATLMGRNVTGT